jgi:threonine dehydratase
MCGKAGCYLQIQHSDGTIFSGTWVSNVIVGGGTMTFEVGQGLYDGPTKVSSSIGRGMGAAATTALLFEMCRPVGILVIICCYRAVILPISLCRSR